MYINYTVVFNTREGARVLVSMNGRLLKKTGKIICMYDNSTGSLSTVETYRQRQKTNKGNAKRGVSPRLKI